MVITDGIKPNKPINRIPAIATPKTAPTSKKITPILNPTVTIAINMQIHFPGHASNADITPIPYMIINATEKISANISDGCGKIAAVSVTNTKLTIVIKLVKQQTA